MNQLLKALRAAGYTGKADVAAIKEWLSGNPIEFSLDGKTYSGDELAAEAVKPAKVEIKSTPNDDPNDGSDDDDDQPVTRKGAFQKAGEKLATGGKGEKIVGRPFRAHTPSQTLRIADEKAYNKRAASGATVFTDGEEATAFKAWFRSTALGKVGYAEHANDLDIIAKANLETVFTTGGALVPSVFIPNLLVLREKYGVASRICRTINSPTGEATFPRRTGGMTVYAPGESGAGTESTTTVDNVTVVATKRMCLGRYSNELATDGSVSIADRIANEMIYAFEKEKDNALINGDGTTTYFGSVGFRTAFTALSGTIANIAGLFVGTAPSSTYGSLTLGDFENTMGLHPELDVAMGEPFWLVNKRFFYGTMVRLAVAAGGVTRDEVQGGMSPVFLGAPVVFARAMPRTTAASQVCALFGNFDLAATIVLPPDGMEIMSSEHYSFNTDEIVVRGRHRYGLTVHDVGDASATESLRNPGPVVGLITNAS